MKQRAHRWMIAVAVVVVTVTATVPAMATEAKDRDGRWGAGLELGLWKRTGGEQDYSNLDGFGSAHLNRGLSKDWNLQVALRYGYTRAGVGMPGESAGWSTESGAALYTTTWQPSVRLQRRFSLGARAVPYVGAGLGLMSWRVVDHFGDEGDVGLMPDGDPVTGYDTAGKARELKRTEFVVTGEMGLEYALGDQWAMVGGVRLHWTPANEMDNVGLSSRWGVDHVDANPTAVDFFLGATFWFGGDADRDDDGILNVDDACPDAAEDVDGYRDGDGCPDLDNDGDGIPDLMDHCPGQAEDLDGFEDADGCPDPDNDGDGIIDADDACPEEAEDLDGHADDDGCPEADNDGDGVDDDADRCPDTPAGAEVDASGCEVVPEPAPAVENPLPPLPAAGQTITLELTGFASGSSRLLPGSEDYLDQWATFIADDPDMVVEVRGHTDSVGSAELNRELSQRRASHVRDQLIQRGAAPGQITAVGYGEDKPVAPNNTREGRAQNRRVELFRVR
ncbi:MAG: OmpA family protein [bacterium]|nr:OmpA family protein [bacterium]